MTKTDRKPESGQRAPKGTGFWKILRLSLDQQQQRHLLLFVLALILTAIIIPKGGFVPDYYAPGDIVSRDIKAPNDLLIPDLPLTETKRQEAEEAVLPFYDYDPKTAVDTAERLIQALKLVSGQPDPAGTSETLRKGVEGALGISLSDQEFSGFVKLRAGSGNLARLRSAVTQALSKNIVGNLQLFQADQERGITIRDLVSQKETVAPALQDVVGVGDAQEALNQGIEGIGEFSVKERQVLLSLVQKLLRPNLTFNKNETEARKRQAREGIKPVLFQVKKGEMIVREGERASEEQIKKLRAMRELGSDYSTLRTGLGLLLCTMLLVFSCHRYARRNIRKYQPVNRDLLFLGLTFIGLFVLIKLAIFVFTALESAFPYIDSTSYHYLLPFAVGAMLVRIVLNSEIALIFAVLSSLLLGVLFGDNLFITFYALVGSLTGAHWVRQCKERSTLYHAGLRISLVNALLIFAIHLMAGRAFDPQLLYKLGFGLVSGFLCAVTVNGTIPLVESIFKYTTDIKLLELANMNKPVLRELMIQAPGTYHHSVIVGNLVEAAAEVINANPLLARVAAYYHDVGKIRKPLYFVENLGNQENRHDKLAPSMSALILMSHVKDGVEIARENKLGENLVDIIRQHHGTALIKFFYDKAKNKEDPGVQQVDERDYRYPGPKPQTREAALIMLADAVEAASRTLTEPTPARIQGMVQKIVNNIFIDGQLDECELTLKDLHNIAKSFNLILAGIFHHRIDYPEPAYKERDKDAAKRKNGEDTNREPAKETKDKEAEPAKSGSEDLKRLGMS
jgi:putative nucleotidyltransferase with HDIG domain